jgi:dolichol kinase
MANLQTTDITGDVTMSGILSGTAYSTTASLAGTDVDFTTAQVFSKTLTGSTTLTFSNTQIGMVKDLIIDGNYTLTLPTGSVAAGEYDGTATNLVQVLVVGDQANSASYWYSFSQPQ